MLPEHAPRTRAEVEALLAALVQPLVPRFSPGCARVELGATGASYPREVAGLEGFARLLWGLAPHAAGGGESGAWERVQAGLAHGSDPAHPEYWGEPEHRDQRIVEMAPLAFALCLAPERVWTPLPPAAREALASYLRRINGLTFTDNNWKFFRVLVNLALTRLDAGPDAARMAADLDLLEGFHLGGGWYSDGKTAQRDYYVAFSMHYYGLIYAALAADLDPARCARFRERAAQFAQDFIHWFSAEGAAIPFGRSLTYRFAQGAFWGALAFAGVEALPWGVLKGLLLRHLRWWTRQPMLTDGGLLSIGYAYPNLIMAEEYNGPASPYWALKAFLPLALPESHPFWSAPEQPLPDLPPLVRQEQPGMLISRDALRDHVVAFAGGQWVAYRPRHTAEKYSKFCYSTHFAFSVPCGHDGLPQGAHDSALALSEEGTYFRVRGECTEVVAGDRFLASTWRPWPDVEVRTWLLPLGAWHARIHRLRSRRPLLSAEGGFAVDCANPDPQGRAWGSRSQKGLAEGRFPGGLSRVCDLTGTRQGAVVPAAPNTNLQAPRTVIPFLLGRHPAGETWLAGLVLGTPLRPGQDDPPWPGVQWRQAPQGFVLADDRGETLFAP